MAQGLVPALLLASLAGCDVYSTNEVKPGDPKYPQANAHAKQVVPLVVMGLDYAKVTFNAVYTGNLCKRQVGEGGVFPLLVATPIAMEPIQGGHRGAVVLDQFLPGDCGWTLTNVTYSTAGEGGPLVANSLLVTGETAAGIEVSRTPHLDFWCYQKIPEQFGTLPQPRCEDLAMILWPNALRRVTSAFRSRLTPEQQRSGGPKRITADTEEVTVTLHNLEAEPGAMEPPHPDGT